jgi:hypothetical protein
VAQCVGPEFKFQFCKKKKKKRRRRRSRNSRTDTSPFTVSLDENGPLAFAQKL